MRRIARVGLVPVLLAVGFGGTAVRAATPTPPATTERDTAPPTPAAGAPAAPTKAILLGGAQVFWDDNSDNEQGFRIAVWVSGGGPDRTATYEAPPNTVSFILPPDAPRACDEPTAYAIYISVVAFNAAGESTPSRYGISTECFEPSPLTTVGSQLPSTGGGRDSHGEGDLATPVGIAGAGVLAAGAGLLAMRRARRRR